MSYLAIIFVINLRIQPDIDRQIVVVESNHRWIVEVKHLPFNRYLNLIAKD